MYKGKLAVLVAVVVLLFAAGLVYYDTRLIRAEQTAQAQNTQTAGMGNLINQTEGVETGSSTQNTVPESSLITLEELGSKTLTKTEAVTVNGNSPEFEMELKLCENTDKKTFIRLQFYLNGAGVDQELDEGELPELAGIFENREKETGNTEAFKIAQALLNPVYSQLYLLIQGAPLGAYTQTSLYLIELNGMSVKKLFSYPGLYGKMVLNKDFRLLAYHFGDPPHLSNFQEDNLVEVFDCTSGEYVIKGNRDKSGNVLGKNSSPDYLYDYEFESWQSVNVLKLRQAMRPKNDVDSGLVQIEVLFDIQKNLLLHLDGNEQKFIVADGATAASDATGTAGTGGSAASVAGDKTTTDTAINADANNQGKMADSEPVNVLKSFYSYLASEKDYTLAMQLLDSNFRLRLGILEQFGAKEIVKSDIDADNASIYSNLLKAAKLDTITKYVQKEDISTITYYQILGLNAETQIKQPMLAQLKKFGKTWKIILIEDGI